MQASNEEAKSVEILKLQKSLESLSLELDAAKLATIKECNKNEMLQNQLELSMKENSAFKREIVSIAELKKENAYLKVSYVYLFSITYLLDRTFLCIRFCFSLVYMCFMLLTKWIFSQIHDIHFLFVHIHFSAVFFGHIGKQECCPGTCSFQCSKGDYRCY